MKALDTYRLPAALAAALSTGRRELVDLHMETEGVTPVEMAEVFRLVADLIEDRTRASWRLEELQQVIAMAVQTVDGNMRRLELAAVEAA